MSSLPRIISPEANISRHMLLDESSRRLKDFVEFWKDENDDDDDDNKATRATENHRDRRRRIGLDGKTAAQFLAIASEETKLAIEEIHWTVSLHPIEGQKDEKEEQGLRKAEAAALVRLFEPDAFLPRLAYMRVYITGWYATETEEDAEAEKNLSRDHLLKMYTKYVDEILEALRVRGVARQPVPLTTILMSVDISRTHQSLSSPWTMNPFDPWSCPWLARQLEEEEYLEMLVWIDEVNTADMRRHQRSGLARSLELLPEEVTTLEMTFVAQPSLIAVSPVDQFPTGDDLSNTLRLVSGRMWRLKIMGGPSLNWWQLFDPRRYPTDPWQAPRWQALELCEITMSPLQADGSWLTEERNARELPQEKWLPVPVAGSAVKVPRGLEQQVESFGFSPVGGYELTSSTSWSSASAFESSPARWVGFAPMGGEYPRSELAQKRIDAAPIGYECGSGFHNPVIVFAPPPGAPPRVFLRTHICMENLRSLAKLTATAVTHMPKLLELHIRIEEADISLEIEVEHEDQDEDDRECSLNVRLHTSPALQGSSEIQPWVDDWLNRAAEPVYFATPDYEPPRRETLRFDEFSFYLNSYPCQTWCRRTRRYHNIPFFDLQRDKFDHILMSRIFLERDR